MNHRGSTSLSAACLDEQAWRVSVKVTGMLLRLGVISRNLYFNISEVEFVNKWVDRAHGL